LKGIRPFAVAAVCAVATALPACGSSDSKDHEDGGGTGGASAAIDAGSGGSQPADSGSNPACKADNDCTPETECSGGKCVARAVCPSALEATYESINAKIFAVSCGTDGNSCHSTKGALNSGALDLHDDAYSALLGGSGDGAGASNIEGSEKGLKRVVPGDADNSFLVIKLSTKTGMDPKYGSGMPFTDPGSVCPDTLAAVRAWIDAGAKK
jgi:hypothetical protein